MAKKDFMTELSGSIPNFDGQQITQTEEEHEKQKVNRRRAREEKNENLNNHQRARRGRWMQKGDKIAEERKHLSVYLPKSLCEKLDAYVALSPYSRNALIYKLVNDYLTEDRMKRVEKAKTELGH